MMMTFEKAEATLGSIATCSPSWPSPKDMQVKSLKELAILEWERKLLS